MLLYPIQELPLKIQVAEVGCSLSFNYSVVSKVVSPFYIYFISIRIKIEVFKQIQITE